MGKMCLICEKQIEGKYVPKGKFGICHPCIDRYYGGITQYRKSHGKTEWKVI